MELTRSLNKIKVVFVSIFMILSFELLLFSQNLILDPLMKIDFFNFTEIKLILTMIYQVLCYLLIFYVFRKIFYSRPIKKFKAMNSSLLYVRLFIIAYLMSASTLSFFTYVVDVPPSESEVFFTELAGAYPWFAIISALIIAPVCEEMFFRYFILRYLKTQMRPVFAILISALLFGAFHLNLRQFIFASALGIVLGIFYHKSGDIKHSIFLHFSFNLASFLSLLFVIKPYIAFPLTIFMILRTLKHSYVLDPEREL